MTLSTALLLTLPLLHAPGLVPFDEGMWLPTQIQDLPLEELRERGFAVSLESLITTDGSPALQHAIVRLAGAGSYGTSSFVSRQGLLLTNHHVAFGAIQQNSSVGADHITNGFVAKSHAEELACPGFTVHVTMFMQEIEGAPTSPQDLQRLTQKLGAPEGPGIRHQVMQTLSGLKTYLLSMLILEDVRLVYAPPRSIGEYGGDTDNWMWPRHSGDFAFMRAYVAPDGSPRAYHAENVPYTPKFHLELAPQGPRQGEFVFVMGYPGATFRYRSSQSLRHRAERSHPTEIALLQCDADMLHLWMDGNRAREIEHADEIRGIENVLKNRKGMVDGMGARGVVKAAQMREADLAAFLASDPQRQQKYGNVLPNIAQAYEDLWQADQRQQFIQGVLERSPVFELATQIAEALDGLPEGANERAAVSKTLREAQKRAFANRSFEHERERFARLMRIGLDLPGNQKIAALEKVVAGTEGEAARQQKLDEFVDHIFSSSLVLKEAALERAVTSGAEGWDHDAVIALTRELVQDLEEAGKVWNTFVQRITVERPRLMEAFEAFLGSSSLYPDANTSLRFTYGSVKGYSPRDGVRYTHLTSVAGMLAKDTGVRPFDAPAEVRAVHTEGDLGPYTDPDLEDVPVCFLSDTDITGGNSGSPIMNGKGQVVGVVFDGTYEGMTSDYRFDPEVTRTISVDVRYMLFLCDKVYGAGHLLEEMGVQRSS